MHTRHHGRARARPSSQTRITPEHSARQLLRLRIGLGLAVAVFVGGVMACGALWLGEQGWLAALIGLLGGAGAAVAALTSKF